MGEKLEKLKEIEDKKKLLEGYAEEENVGPDHFKVGAKLGEGSFGHIYLAEKLINKEDGDKIPTGKFYAMKVLNKR